MYLVSIFVFILTPRVIPIPIVKAKSEIKKWKDQAQSHDNIEDANHFSLALNTYNSHSSENIGCIAVLHHTKLRAFALMEMKNKTLSICDITSKDYYSGSLLMHSFVNTIEDGFNLKENIDKRWIIAKMYFSPVYNDTMYTSY
tara:strand:- start:1692 stop:2120 length:429 start_codon:yes stop_codon:yes gene_type:complete